MMSLESPGSIEEFRKLLMEYSQYSANLKNWLYEDLTSIMGICEIEGFFFCLIDLFWCDPPLLPFPNRSRFTESDLHFMQYFALSGLDLAFHILPQFLHSNLYQNLGSGVLCLTSPSASLSASVMIGFPSGSNFTGILMSMSWSFIGQAPLFQREILRMSSDIWLKACSEVSRNTL